MGRNNRLPRRDGDYTSQSRNPSHITIVERNHDSHRKPMSENTTQEHPQPASQPRPSPPPSQGGAFKKNDAGAPSQHNLIILGFHLGYVGGGQKEDLSAANKKGNDA